MDDGSQRAVEFVRSGRGRKYEILAPAPYRSWFVAANALLGVPFQLQFIQTLNLLQVRRTKDIGASVSVSRIWLFAWFASQSAKS
jgi:hypothetical protein